MIRQCKSEITTIIKWINKCRGEIAGKTNLNPPTLIPLYNLIIRIHSYKRENKRNLSRTHFVCEFCHKQRKQWTIRSNTHKLIRIRRKLSIKTRACCGLNTILKRKRSENLVACDASVPRVTIEYVTDLDVQSPIRTDEHVGRGTFHQRVHHLCSPTTVRSEIETFPVTVNEIPTRSRSNSGDNRAQDITTSLSLSISLPRRLVHCRIEFRWRKVGYNRN